MHETYVIGGISGNNWEREEIKVKKAGANWTVDEIVGEATGRGIVIPNTTQPLTCLGAAISSYSKSNTFFLSDMDTLLIRLSDDGLSFIKQVNAEETFGTNRTETISQAQYLSYYSGFDYFFSPSDGVVDLPNDVLFSDLRVFEVTLSKACMKTGFRRWTIEGEGSMFEYDGEDGGWAAGMSEVFGYDVPMVNQVMFGIVRPPPTRSKNPIQDGYKESLEKWFSGSDPLDYLKRTGHLLSLSTLEKWDYDSKNIAAVTKISFIYGFFIKCVFVGFSFFAFFFMSCFTAFTVRILTTSGVVIIFPILKCLSCCGAIRPDSMEVVRVSYPWIGLPIRAHTSLPAERGISQTANSAIIIPHAVKLLIYYSLYSLSQQSISTATYSEPYPYSMPIGVWGMIMMWEYFAMVVLRGVEGIHFFPQFCALCFVTFHMYFHCFAYPYSDLALWPMLFASLGGMLYCFMVLEVPKHRDGILSEENPREVWNGLGWGEWTGNLPQEFTMFMSLNERYRPLGTAEDDDHEVAGGLGGDESDADNDGEEGDGSDISLDLEQGRESSASQEEGVEMTLINSDSLNSRGGGGGGGGTLERRRGGSGSS
ncbi:hypothetical protein TrVE_jg12457 [Triparma verrucosa]|uniref:Uncharacterized protein n=1 Tax=Triparma verrucosa TaxID=1606542 RepID=A0A9W7BF21_9STRA|nr:hypothetical protein TrVE_jg12457 [Triparma verrucosa]